MNRFIVKSEFAAAFEERWRSRESLLDQASGFMHFRLLKTVQPEATEFVSYSEWRSPAEFNAWLEGDLSKRAHAQPPAKDTTDPKGNDVKAPAQPPVGGMMVKPPEFRMYEVALDQVPGNRTDVRSALMDDIVTQSFAKESVAQARIREQGKVRGLPTINIGAFEGRMIEILLRSNGSKNGVEIGTLGGYSASWIARALPQDGKLISLEKSESNAKIAGELLAEAGLAAKVEIKVGDARATLETLSHLKDLDFVFVDADKANYAHYTRWAIPRLRKGGLLLIDNAYIWGGMLQFGQNAETADLAGSASKAQFAGMSDCWNEVAAHPSLAGLIFSTGDGLGIAVKTT